MAPEKLDAPAPLVLVSGAGLPAAQEFAPLLDVLGDRVRPVVVDLVAFQGKALPSGYSLDTEVQAVRAAADAAAFGVFHLVGYSGGAGVALAFAARFPDRVRSLGLVEPAWVGNDGWDQDEAAFWAALDDLMQTPRAQRLDAFRRLMLHPESGLSLPPVRPDAPWIDAVLTGVEALGRAFRTAQLDYHVLGQFAGRTYCAVGSLSHPVYENRARRLVRWLTGTAPSNGIEIYEGLHHLYPPHRAEPQRFAAALRVLWNGWESRAGT